MFDRFVSLWLITAVIACPMWCDGGLSGCCAAAVCGLDEPTDFCLQQETPTCCCKDSHEGEDRDAPCSDEVECQGVCGGAVFEKPCQLDDGDASFSPPRLDTDESVAVVLTRFREVRVEHYCCCGTRNHGRFVRALHSSFLC